MSDEQRFRGSFRDATGATVVAYLSSDGGRLTLVLPMLGNTVFDRDSALSGRFRGAGDPFAVVDVRGGLELRDGFALVGERPTVARGAFRDVGSGRSYLAGYSDVELAVRFDALKSYRRSARDPLRWVNAADPADSLYFPVALPASAGAGFVFDGYRNARPVVLRDAVTRAVTPALELLGREGVAATSLRVPATGRTYAPSSVGVGVYAAPDGDTYFLARPLSALTGAAPAVEAARGRLTRMVTRDGASFFALVVLEDPALVLLDAGALEVLYPDVVPRATLFRGDRRWLSVPGPAFFDFDAVRPPESPYTDVSFSSLAAPRAPALALRPPRLTSLDLVAALRPGR